MPFKWNAQRIQTLPQLPNQMVSKPTWSERISGSTVWYGSASTVCHDDDAAVDSCVLNLHVAPAASALTSGFPTAVQLLLWSRNAALLWHALCGGFKTKCNPRHLILLDPCAPNPYSLLLSFVFCLIFSSTLLFHKQALVTCPWVSFLPPKTSICWCFFTLPYITAHSLHVGFVI